MFVCQNPATGDLRWFDFMRTMSSVEVHYCRFGKHPQKKTTLWNRVDALEDCKCDGKLAESHLRPQRRQSPGAPSASRRRPHSSHRPGVLHRYQLGDKGHGGRSVLRDPRVQPAGRGEAAAVVRAVQQSLLISVKGRAARVHCARALWRSHNRWPLCLCVRDGVRCRQG